MKMNELTWARSLLSVFDDEIIKSKIEKKAQKKSKT